jgi:hypothetical protein
VGGYSLYVKDQKLHYAYNYLSVQQFDVATTTNIPRGRHELRFEFEPTGEPDLAQGKGTPGLAQLYIDGQLAGEAELPVTIPLTLGLEGLTCGYDGCSPVTPAYQPPFPCTGTLEYVAVDISGNLTRDRQAELREFLARE